MNVSTHLLRFRRKPRSRLRTVLTIGAFVFIGGVTLMFAAGLASVAADAPTTYIAPASGEGLAQGVAIFAERCAACHGQDGAGNIGPALNGSAHAWHHSDQDLRIAIRDGIPRTQMPGHGDVLTEEEIDAVIGYFKTWWSPEQQVKQRKGSTRQ